MKISSITPLSGPIGTKVTIIGSGFTPTNNKITIGGWSGVVEPFANSPDGRTLTFTIPATINANCPLQIICTQPDAGDVYPTMRYDLVPDDYPVNVTNANGGDVASFAVVDPKAATSTISIYPTSGPAGSAYRLNAPSFRHDRFAEVHFRNASGADVVWSDSLPLGVYQVYILSPRGKGGWDESSSTTFTVLSSGPLPVAKITSISPSDISSPGTVVTIKGTGFSTTTKNMFGGRLFNYLTNEVGFGPFNGFLESFDGETITFQVPSFATGSYSVTEKAEAMNANGKESNQVPFTVNIDPNQRCLYKDLSGGHECF